MLLAPTANQGRRITGVIGIAVLAIGAAIAAPYLPPGYPVQPGDAFRVPPGCDKRLDTCAGRFANVLNFRGEPYVPGQDEMMKYPDAK